MQSDEAETRKSKRLSIPNPLYSEDITEFKKVITSERFRNSQPNRKRKSNIIQVINSTLILHLLPSISLMRPTKTLNRCLYLAFLKMEDKLISKLFCPPLNPPHQAKTTSLRTKNLKGIC